MPKPSRLHHGDEFGGAHAGRSMAGVDGPMIGAGAAIRLDAETERESGATPPPPPFTMRSLVIGLVAMLLIGVAILVLVSVLGPQLPVVGQ